MISSSTPPTVSDTILAELAHPANHLQRENCTTHMLQSLAAELREWRRAAQQRPFALSLALRSEAIADRLETARDTLRCPDPVHQNALRTACETILRYTADTTERSAASEVLSQLTEAA